MSAVSSIPSTSASSASSALGQDKLNMQDFLQLLTTQLENQDPMNPMDDSQFFAQMAQLGQVQGIDQLNNSAQVQQAQSLMGQTVTASNPNVGQGGNQPATITGVVNSLSIQNGNYYLGVQQSNGNIVSVPMSSLQSTSQTTSLAGYSSLVGQTVTGYQTVNGQASAVTGNVTSVTMNNGVPMVTIQPKTGTAVTIAAASITSLS